jgi:RND family efflux transporter MFP subunit
MVFPKKVLVITLIVIVSGLLAFFLVVKPRLLSPGEEASESKPEESIRPAEAPLPVQVVTVSRRDLVIKLRSPAEAVTDRKTVMKTEVSGRIKALHVEEGRFIRKGDLLVELDDREYSLELEKAEASRLKVLSELMLEKQFAEPSQKAEESYAAEIENARREYEKSYSQYRQGLLSEDEWEEAFKRYEMVLIESGQKKEEIMAATKGLTLQEINVKKARLNLEKTKILAPFEGVVTDIKVTEQQQVSAGSELFTLVNTSRVHVQAKVLESEIGKMRVGREVDLKFSAYPEDVFKGRVKAVSPLVNSDDKTCRVIISIVRSDRVIKPGMHADVEIEAAIHKDRLLVPREAIVVRSGKKMVFVVEDGRARRRYIETGLENEDFAEVLENDEEGAGLKEGETVIVEGHYTLAEDARVRIQK